jgi:glucokinase
MVTSRGGFAIGVDLGGTNIASGVLDSKGRILCKIKLPTKASEGPQAVIGRMAASVTRLLANTRIPASRIRGVGVGSPGPLSSKTGVVYFAPNLRGFKNIPLRDLLHRQIKLPVLLENDANAACFGEFWAGAGKGLQNLLMVTLGTGVGGGIILGGKLYSGVDDTAGELGHMIIQRGGPLCGCGQRGCLEQYASATAIARRGRELAGKNSLLLKLANGKAGNITAKLVNDAALRGDAAGKKVMAETAVWLGIGLANLINIFNPQMIVLGGGVMGAGRPFLKSVEKEAKARAFARPAKTVKIVAARLGDDAGLVGAAGIVFARM